jgi:tyrosyl-tRNA synthetase
MSQSLNNYIGVSDPPDEIFGKVMSIPDALMPQWFRLATELPEAEVGRVVAELEKGALHPGEAKRLLARSLVGLYWSDAAAATAEAAFDRLFRDHEAPAEVPIAALPDGDPLHLPSILRDLGLVPSGSEARRLIEQGAVKVNGKKVLSEEVARDDLVDAVLQVGKRRFIKLTA